MKSRFATVLAAVLGCCAASGPARGEDALSGTHWVLGVLIGTSANIGGGTVSMAFDNGRVQGSDGCNRYRTSYVVNGERLKFDEDIASTRISCIQSAMMQAVAFFEALRVTARYRRQGEQLTLLDAKGETLAVFGLRGP